MHEELRKLEGFFLGAPYLRFGVKMRNRDRRLFEYETNEGGGLCFAVEWEGAVKAV